MERISLNEVVHLLDVVGILYRFVLFLENFVLLGRLKSDLVIFNLYSEFLVDRKIIFDSRNQYGLL